MVYFFFLFLFENIHCGYSLEPPRRGSSNEYPQSMFWAEIWKISEFFIWKFSVSGGKISIYLNRRIFVMIWFSPFYCLLMWLKIIVCVLTHSTLRKIFSSCRFEICVSYFSQETGFDITCKLSQWRQFAWNVKSCFPEKIRQISKCYLLNLVKG